MARHRRERGADELPEAPFRIDVSDGANADLERLEQAHPGLAKQFAAQMAELGLAADVTLESKQSAIKYFVRGPLAGHWRMALTCRSAAEPHRAIFLVNHEQRCVEVWYVGPWREAYARAGAVARLRAWMCSRASR